VLWAECRISASGNCQRAIAGSRPQASGRGWQKPNVLLSLIWLVVRTNSKTLTEDLRPPSTLVIINMSQKPKGRRIRPIITDHFVAVEKIQNSSNSYLFQCKYCSKTMEGRDDKHLKHLLDGIHVPRPLTMFAQTFVPIWLQRAEIRTFYPHQSPQVILGLCLPHQLLKAQVRVIVLLPC
jgi:hypothetical protein